MKPFLFFVVSCLVLHSGKGAPKRAVYNFVRCNPEGDKANCVTYQTPEMAWSADLPEKLPASTAKYLEAEPVKEESPMWEEKEDDEKKVNAEEEPMTKEEGESPADYLFEEGSGAYEGSATGAALIKDQAFEGPETEMGSGETWEKGLDLGEDVILRQLFPSRDLAGEDKPAEQDLKEDHLLQL